MSRDSNMSASRRKFMGALGAGTIAVSGCLTDGEEAADSLEIWSLGTLPDGLEVVAENYNEENGTDVEFDIQELGYGELHDSVFSAIAGSSGGPDVGTYEGRFTPTLIGTGGLVNFEDRVDEETEEAYVDAAWGMVSDTQGEGRYGLPIDFAPVATFYNREIYDEYGFSPDDLETYDDFIDAAGQVDDDVTWMAVGGDVLEWRWELLLRQQDGEAYTEDGALMLNTEETRQAADLLKELYDTGTAENLQEFSEPWSAGLGDGNIATVTSGAWMQGALEGVLGDDHAGNWGIHAPPAVESGGNRSTLHGGSNLVIPAHHDDAVIERAADFIEFALTNEEQVIAYATEAGVFPAHTGAYDHEYYEQELDYWGGDTLEIFIDLAANIPAMRMIEDHREVYSRMGDFLANYCVEGEYASAEEMAEDAEGTIADEVGLDVA